MKTSTVVKVLGLAASLSLPVSGALGAPRPTLEQILANQDLWGKDFPAVVGSLPAWQAAGERRVVVLPGAVVGARTFASQAEAQVALAAFGRRIAASVPRLRKPFEATAAPAAEARTRFRAQIAGVDAGERPRVAWTTDSAQLLAPDLTAKRVEELLGKPESVTTELVQTEKERRPEVLTLHRYAGGAVAFAESDMSPVPGAIGRVFLDVPAAARAMFRR